MNANQIKKSGSDFNFKSLRETLSLLDCSKFYLYALIKSGKISPYYFEKDSQGKPKGKPYFKLDEIAESLIKVEKSES